MILPECRPLWEGIEGADSMVINAHKWLGLAFDCSLYYVRDPSTWFGLFDQPQLPAISSVAKVKNFRDWGIPLGRRFPR